ncbi:hypothetical protein FRB90_004073, partial [Tulasnella sp. 427]
APEVEEALPQAGSEPEIPSVDLSSAETAMPDAETTDSQTSNPLSADDSELAIPTPPQVQLVEAAVATEPEPEPELFLPVFSEQGVQTSCEPGVQVRTSEIGIQASPAKQKSSHQQHELQEAKIAGFKVNEECTSKTFYFQINSELYAKLKSDEASKILATCLQEDDGVAVDDRWVLIRVNGAGNSGTELFLTATKSKKARGRAIPWDMLEMANRLELQCPHGLGGLKGIRIEIKAVLPICQQRKRTRDIMEEESEVNGNGLTAVTEGFKKARI